MPRKKTTGRIYKSKAVSMDPKLQSDAEDRARSLNMSFSDYVRRCLIVDIYKGGKMVIEPNADGDSKLSKSGKSDHK